MCGPMLVTVPHVVWLRFTVLDVAVLFVITIFVSDCLLCQDLPCPRCDWKIHEVGLTQFRRIFFWWSGDTLLKSWKTMEHESDDDTNCNQSARYSHQTIDTGTWSLRNKRKSWDHPNYSMIKIGQNTEKSPEHLLSLKILWEAIS